MKNSEILENILSIMEKEHINLYHDISKVEVDEYVSNVKNIDNLSPIEFDYEMLKLFALFKDAHTNYFVPFKPLSHKILYCNDNFYIKIDEKWVTIKTFDDLNANKFYDNLKIIINYETQEWLNRRITQRANNAYFYEMLGLMKNRILKISLDNGQILEVREVENIDAENNNSKYLPYDFEILEDNILYLRYSSCINLDEKPFISLVEEMKKIIKEKDITKYILDVRGNTGGDSEILNPFQQLVRNWGLKGVLLIDNGVFSSGRFAVARFKKEFNTLLIGQPTGGASKSYGYLKRLEFEGKRFSVSVRLWDFSETFGYEGSIQPDVFVPIDIENIQNKEDVILNKAIEVVKTLN